MTVIEVCGIIGAFSALLGGVVVMVHRQIRAWVIEMASRNVDVKANKADIETVKKEQIEKDKLIALIKMTLEVHKEEIDKMDDRFADFVREIFKLFRDNNI